jgi:AraC-like DNA-binding protein
VNQISAKPPADRFDAVHARLLRFFPEVTQALGGAPDALLAQAGITEEQLLQDSPGLSYLQIIQLLDLAATQLNCPDFGLRLASRLQGIDMFGPLGIVMKNSQNFGEALGYVSTHNFAHSLAARIWLRPCRSEKSVFAAHDILLDGIAHRGQAIEHLLLAGHLLALELTGGQARVRAVYFRHQPLSPLKTYRGYFRCEVHFGQNEDGLVFSDQDLACPIVDPDVNTYRQITAFIETQFTRQLPPLHAQVHGVILQFLGSPNCTNDWTAARLNLHPRTLHRRLAAEGTSFQRIKDEIRRDALLYYIQQTIMDFTRISERLGFAEQSVMTRCCHRWFAASPTRLRQQARSILDRN